MSQYGFYPLPSIIKKAGFIGLCVLALGSGIGHAQTCTDAAATPSVCAFNAAKNAAAKTKIKGVLLYDWTNGGHNRAFTQAHMMRLSQKYGFRLDRSQTQTYITDATLQGIDLIVFNNGDQDPLQNATSLAAVRKFVEVQGKAILVIHAGAAYIPCPSEDISNVSGCRWIMRGLRTQFWIHNGDPTNATIFADSVMTGQTPPRATGTSAVASTRNHGRKNPETRMIFEELPTNAGAGANANRPYVWEGLGDEWYNYQNNPRLDGQRTIDGITYGPMNILLSLDESTVASNATCNGGTNACKNQGTFGDRPVSWTRKMGNGLFAYQNAGHSNVYTRVRSVGGTNVNDSIIEKYNWRLMRYLARDFVGCMTPGDSKYNPEASVTVLTPGIDTATPCAGPSHTLVKGKVSANLVVEEGRVIVPTIEREHYRIMVANSKGQHIFSAELTGGPGQNITAVEGRKGVFYVEVSSPKLGKTVTKVDLK
jgi:type 1 glutamine amidotransferase